jgi:hypothetical protein
MADNNYLAILKNKTQDPLIRKEACAHLSCEVLEALDETGHDYFEVTNEIVQKLGSLREKKALPKLLKLLQNDLRTFCALKKSLILAIYAIDPKNAILQDKLVQYTENTLLCELSLRLLGELHYPKLEMLGKTTETVKGYISSRMALSRTISSTPNSQKYCLENYKKAFAFFLQNYKTKPGITELKTLHKLIIGSTQKINGLPSIDGKWQGVIRGSNDDIYRIEITIKYPKTAEVPKLVNKLFAECIACSGYMEAPGPQLASHVYKTLIQIHPFYDGCGRTVRLFVDWILGNKGLFMAEYPKEYINAMLDTEAHTTKEIKKNVEPIDKFTF